MTLQTIVTSNFKLWKVNGFIVEKVIKLFGMSNVTLQDLKIISFSICFLYYLDTIKLFLFYFHPIYFLGCIIVLPHTDCLYTSCLFMLYITLFSFISSMTCRNRHQVVFFFLKTAIFILLRFNFIEICIIIFFS